MKILFIIDTLQGSGAERSIVEISLKLKRFTPVFVSVYKGSMLSSYLEEEGVKVYSLNIEQKYGFSEAVELLKPIYKNEKPDIVHSTLYKSDMVARKMKSLFPEIPLVGSFVNNSYMPGRYKNQSLLMKLKLKYFYEMDKYTARKVDFFISNSATIAKSEGGALGVPPGKIKVIFRGRDPKKFEKVLDSEVLNLKQDLNINNKLVLLNVSRLITRKAQKDILLALPKVLQEFPDLVLLFAGHGDQENSLKEEVRKLNLQNNVLFLGRRKDVPSLLAAADVFVYPSYAEGLPGALIEAMFAESLIVASDIGENLECVDEKSALIFSKGDVQQLSEKIILALKNKDGLTKIFGSKARTQAIQKFEIGNIAEQYEEVYKELILK